MLKIVILFALSAISIADRSYLEFEIRKKHTSVDQAVSAGKLVINIHAAPSLIEPYFEANVKELVTPEDLTDSHQAIL